MKIKLTYPPNYHGFTGVAKRLCDMNSNEIEIADIVYPDDLWDGDEVFIEVIDDFGKTRWVYLGKDEFKIISE